MCYIQIDTDSLTTPIRRSKQVQGTAVYNCVTVNIGAPRTFYHLLPFNNVSSKVLNNELLTQEERCYSHNICAVLHLWRFR